MVARAAATTRQFKEKRKAGGGGGLGLWDSTETSESRRGGLGGETRVTSAS